MERGREGIMGGREREGGLQEMEGKREARRERRVEEGMEEDGGRDGGKEGREGDPTTSVSRITYIIVVICALCV